MALSFFGLSFSVIYIIVIVLLGLWVISRIIEWISKRGKGTTEEKIGGDEEAEAAIVEEDHKLEEKEGQVVNLKLNLIKRNLDLVKKSTEQNTAEELKKTIDQIINIINQEIKMLKDHIKNAKDEMGLITQEIEDSGLITDKEKNRSAEIEGEQVVMQQESLKAQEELQKILNNKVRLVSEQLKLLEKKGSILGMGWKLLGKTQLSQAKEEQSTLSKGKDAENIIPIAEYLFSSETIIIGIDKNLQTIRTNLETIGNQSIQAARSGAEIRKTEAA